MLSKLIRYEVKENFKKAKIIYVSYFIVAFLLGLMLYGTLAVKPDSMSHYGSTSGLSSTLFLMMAFGFLTFALYYICIASIFRNYYRRFFGPSAVFYRTLPASYNQKCLSITISWTIFYLITMLIMVLSSLWIIGLTVLAGLNRANNGSDIYEAFNQFINGVDLGQVLALIFYSVIIAFMFVVLFAVRAMFIVNLVHLGFMRSSAWKVPAGILVYLLLSFVENKFLNLFNHELIVNPFLFGLHQGNTLNVLENSTLLTDTIHQTLSNSLRDAFPYFLGTVVLIVIFTSFYWLINGVLVKEVDL